MPYTINVEEAAPRLLAATRSQATLATLAPAIRPLFDIVYAHLSQTQIPHLGLNIILYAPLSGEEFLLDAGVEVPARFESSDLVRPIDTPAGRVATTPHFGEYGDLHHAHAAIRAWADANGAALSGPNWEVYGHWEDDPAKRRTDVYYLLG